MGKKLGGGQAHAGISAKIAKLRREGKSGKEAAGEAYGMARAGRLTSTGRYIGKGKA